MRRNVRKFKSKDAIRMYAAQMSRKFAEEEYTKAVTVEHCLGSIFKFNPCIYEKVRDTEVEYNLMGTKEKRKGVNVHIVWSLYHGRHIYYDIYLSAKIKIEDNTDIMEEKMTKQREIAEAIVRQYAKGLSELDLSLIADILHPEFKFVYRVGGRDSIIVAHPSRLEEAIKREQPIRGHGIRTDVRYIGHLYRTFLAMKKEGLSIKTDFFYSEIDGEQILCIKLLPPHDHRIIYPMSIQLREGYRRKVPTTGEVCLLPRVKHGLLCKVECYDSMQMFNCFVEGTFDRGVPKDWIKT